jgi:hypothetical protein
VDVALTSEQAQWNEAVGRLAAAHAVTVPSAIPGDGDGRGWQAVLNLGIPALRSPELSGVDAAGVESALAVEQLGRHLCALPVVGQGVLAPELLHASGAESLLEAVASGERRIAPTLTADLQDLARLGEPAVAFDAAGATHALVLDGDELVVVALAPGAQEGLDLTRVVLPVDPAASAERTGLHIDKDRLDRVRAVALTAVSADLLGVMDGAVRDAVAYAKIRKQFGTAIGSFQAVQHLLADAAVAVEGARSCVWHAAWAGDHLDPSEALLAARTAKAYCAELGLRTVEASVQVFGGIAITWEHLSHLRLRRAHLDRACLGDEHVQHRGIAASLLGRAAVA